MVGMNKLKSRALAERLAESSKHRPKKKPFSVSESVKILRKISAVVKESRAKWDNDRAGYGATLLGNFRNLAEYLKLVASKLLTGEIELNSVDFDGIMNLFEFWNFAVFEPLADNLTYDEEEAWREIMDSLREGWRLFFGVCRVRLPLEENPDVLGGEETAIACTNFVELFFLGEIETELSDEYLSYGQLLKKTLADMKARAK